MTETLASWNRDINVHVFIFLLSHYIIIIVGVTKSRTKYIKVDWRRTAVASRTVNAPEMRWILAKYVLFVDANAVLSLFLSSDAQYTLFFFFIIQITYRYIY